MDNVSHTLAGLLLAEAAVQVRLRRADALSPRFARTAHLISAAANNLPDLDSLYAGITQPRSLGYLLHHRGHTHTLPVALLLVALLVLVAQRAGRRLALSRTDWTWLWALGLGGGVLHLAMDFVNDYGVHPFWPLYKGWFYGDFVFIIEPLFFALCVPPVLASVRSLWLRVVLALVLCGVFYMVWSSAWLPSAVALFISIVALLSLVVAFKLNPWRRIIVAFSASLLVVLVFWGTRFLVRVSALSSLPVAAALQDIALRPVPANPLCWSVWRVSSQAGVYLAERGVVAALPELLPADRCQVEPQDDPTAPITALDVRESPAVRWTGRFSAPVAELAAIDRRSCFAAAFFRYARVPYWTERAGETIVGDLRYDRAATLEFADFALPVGQSARSAAAANTTVGQLCPRWVPDWTPPRQELLR